MVDSIGKELLLQRDYLDGEPIETIYLGGGTPSLLSSDELRSLLNAIYDNFEVIDSPEICLEANPDDLNPRNLSVMADLGINRLSIGIQSFDDNHLRYLNRAHNSIEALHCVEQARYAGIDNISIDLIYGIPNDSHDLWEKDLMQAIALKPTHISSYCLTIENKTVFGNWLKKGKIQQVNDEYAAQQFEILFKTLSDNGYEQYEVSNFCLPNKYSIHNSNYWKQKKYLGVGPSAHSYNGVTRQYNISNNKKYIDSIAEDNVPFTLDVLDHNDHINEYLLTTLRTKWGANLNTLKEKYNFDLLEIHRKYIDELLQKNLITSDDNALILTNEGKLFADKIASDLFLL
jgi:oxygen-independent coproporphyrinogen-3 oxidase